MPLPPSEPAPDDSIRQTLQALDSAAADTSLASITRLGIPQVRALKREIAAVFPASNLPAFLLQGLLQLTGHGLDRERVSGDLRVLFRETSRIGLYGTFLAAPAAIIHGYQRLLTLAGKDAASAFPDGTWQFYTEFGLRDDAARHCVETDGFARAAPGLSLEQSAACWVYAALHTLFCYDELLAVEWRERALLRCVDLALQEAAAGSLGRRLPRRADERARAVAAEAERLRADYGLGRLAADWIARRPYHGPADDPLEGYPAARGRALDSYLGQRLAAAPAGLAVRAREHFSAWQARDLAPFQVQMSIQASLHPDTFREQRRPLPFDQLCVALVSGGRYSLIEICERDEAGRLLITPRGGDPARPGQPLPLARDDDGELVDRYGQPVQIDRIGRVRVAGVMVGQLRRPSMAAVRASVAAALRASRPLPASAPRPAGVDTMLAAAPRNRQEQLRGLLGREARAELALLRRAPIVVCWDDHDRRLPLGQIRRGNRGCGDQALTISRAGAGVVFDMSHIFFDGAWGSILAELVTGFATGLAPHVAGRPASAAPPPTLGLEAGPAFYAAARSAADLAPVEAAAESDAVRLDAIHSLRRKLAAREVEITVNDFLLLARYEHAASYRPGPAALAALDDLAAAGAPGLALRNQIMAWIDEQRLVAPALLVPMDASGIDPRARLHPAALLNPCPALLPRLADCETSLRAWLKADDADALRIFLARRTELCGELLHFGALLRALREVTTSGEGFTTAALKLMAHLPQPAQSLLDRIPQKIDVLNEIVKGSEVFSNIGQVGGGSSLVRFMSSRDDGDTKLLVWGVMSDPAGRLVITLRDFRPHVGQLLRAGHAALADVLAADYLAAYATSANGLVRRLTRVLAYK